MHLPLDDPTRSNEIYLDFLTKMLERSQHVSRAVLLALDGVYENGVLSEAKTDLLIPNDYLFAIVERSPKRFLAGASINPLRRDALAELDRCASRGAALVKFLPNLQGFRPEDPQCLPFYKALASKKIPLLCHIGNELALPSPWARFSDPTSLLPALEQGVTVIFAHGCTRGTFFRDHFVQRFLELTQKFPNLFADLSATTGPHRSNSLFTFRRHPEVHDRLLFATDYPIPVSTFPLWGRVPLAKVREIAGVESPFDRQFLILQELGIRFRNFGDLFSSVRSA